MTKRRLSHRSSQDGEDDDEQDDHEDVSQTQRFAVNDSNEIVRYLLLKNCTRCVIDPRKIKLKVPSTTFSKALASAKQKIAYLGLKPIPLKEFAPQSESQTQQTQNHSSAADKFVLTNTVRLDDFRQFMEIESDVSEMGVLAVILSVIKLSTNHSVREEELKSRLLKLDPNFHSSVLDSLIKRFLMQGFLLRTTQPAENDGHQVSLIEFGNRISPAAMDTLVTAVCSNIPGVTDSQPPSSPPQPTSTSSRTSRATPSTSTQPLPSSSPHPMSTPVPTPGPLPPPRRNSKRVAILDDEETDDDADVVQSISKKQRT